MPMEDHEYTALHVDIGVLKNQVSVISQLCEKYDKVIEKILDSQEKSVDQMYRDMDKQKDETDADIREIYKRIDNIHQKMQSTEKNMMDEMKKVRDDLNTNLAQDREKLDKIIQWKWSIVGGIFVLTWLLSNMNFDTLVRMLVR